MRTLSASIQRPEAVVFLLFIALRDNREETLLPKLVFTRTRTLSNSPCFSLSMGGSFSEEGLVKPTNRPESFPFGSDEASLVWVAALSALYADGSRSKLTRSAS